MELKLSLSRNLIIKLILAIMQHRKNEYKPELHDRFKALTLKQPWADKILTGQKKVEVRTWRPSYRGELVITSSKKPEGDRSGITICKVELVEVVPFRELTTEQKYSTAIPESKWKYFNGYYGWILRNPRPLPRFDIAGQLGVWNLIFDRGKLYTVNSSAIPESNEKQKTYSYADIDRAVKFIAATAFGLAIVLILIFLYLLFMK